MAFEFPSFTFHHDKARGKAIYGLTQCFTVRAARIFPKSLEHRAMIKWNARTHPPLLLTHFDQLKAKHLNQLGLTAGLGNKSYTP